jgi:hypothetical protein
MLQRDSHKLDPLITIEKVKRKQARVYQNAFTQLTIENKTTSATSNSIDNASYINAMKVDR